MVTKMFSTLLLFVTIVCIAQGGVVFKDCGSKGAKVLSLDVAGCTSEPCPFVKTTNATLTLNFTASEDVKAPINKLSGIIAGVPVPFPSPEDTCTNKNLQCPVQKGATSMYTNTIYISPSYPNIKLLVKLEVLDDNKNDLFCIVFPAEIVNK